MNLDSLSKLQENFTRHNVPQGDYHIHTTWVDGAHSVSAMHEAAIARGLTQVLFSEHARAMSESWFYKFADEVRALPQEKCRALIGVETRIKDFDGTLDCAKSVFSQCELVLASVHRFPDGKGGVRSFEGVSKKEAEEIELRLAMAALDNPCVQVLAHPFGMCYQRYDVIPSEASIKKLIKKAAETSVAFEINAYYHPDPWKFIKWCREMGARISLGSDAHHFEEVGNIVRILEGKKAIWKR